MYVRRVKRKCGVRGCKNINSFAISLTREVGNSIIACESCINGALEAIKAVAPEAKSNIPAANKTNIPPLFFNAAVRKLIEAPKAEAAPAPAPAAEMEPEQPTEATEAYACSKCGKTFGSNQALIAHSRYCKK